jgi:hypothetical protein
VASYVIVLGIMVLVFAWNPIPATGKPLGILVFTVLALVGTEILIRQTREEFPQARQGETSQAIRARMASMREGRHASGNPSPAAEPTTADQLGRLADLRDRGALPDAEFRAEAEAARRVTGALRPGRAGRPARRAGPRPGRPDPRHHS